MIYKISNNKVDFKTQFFNPKKTKITYKVHLFLKNPTFWYLLTALDKEKDQTEIATSQASSNIAGWLILVRSFSLSREVLSRLWGVIKSVWQRRLRDNRIFLLLYVLNLVVVFFSDFFTIVRAHQLITGNRNKEQN